MTENSPSAYRAAAGAALAAFGLSPREIQLHSIAENITFRVTDAAHGNVYALRLHRPGYRTLKELESEHAWTSALRQSGISVPQPYLSPDGASYVAVRVGGNEEIRFAGVSQWLPGSCLSAWIRLDEAEPQVMQRIMARLGELLARMHVHASGWQTPDGFQRPHLDADALIGEAPRWGRFWDHPALTTPERTLLLDARDRLHDKLAGLAQDGSRYGLIHADMHSDNILVVEQVVSAIDFDDLAFGWYAYDIASALQPHVEHPAYPRWRAALLESYRENHGPNEGDGKLLDVFILVRDLAEIGWYLQRPEVEALNRAHFQSIKARALRACQILQKE